MKRLFLAALFWIAALGAGAADIPAASERTWKIDGVERTALLYIPAAASTRKIPVIFAFHGHGGTMRYAARKFGYQRLWPEAITVYMQGLPTPGALTDPQGLKPGWQKTEGDQGDRDLKFFDAVLATLNKELKVDEKRVFATGHSNGGGFTFVLWAARGDKLAAVAPCAAVAGRNLSRLKPKPAMHIGGENDPLVRFAWQERSMSSVHKLNGCEDAGKPWARAGELIGTVYASKSGTPFVSVIYPGGHNLPDEAPELVVKFFKEQAPSITARSKPATRPADGTPPTSR
jgi:polyhydroxybutyrate depolymerase